MKESVNRIRKAAILKMKKNENLVIILSTAMTILGFGLLLYYLPYLDKMEGRQLIAPFIIFVLTIGFGILIDATMIKLLKEQMSEIAIQPEKKSKNSTNTIGDNELKKQGRSSEKNSKNHFL